MATVRGVSTGRGGPLGRQAWAAGQEAWALDHLSLLAPVLSWSAPSWSQEKEENFLQLSFTDRLRAVDLWKVFSDESKSEWRVTEEGKGHHSTKQGKLSWALWRLS